MTKEILCGNFLYMHFSFILETVTAGLEVLQILTCSLSPSSLPIALPSQGHIISNSEPLPTASTDPH